MEISANLQHDLPKEIQDLSTDQTVCRFCGVSYLIHREVKALKEKMLKLEEELVTCKRAEELEPEYLREIEALKTTCKERESQLSALHSQLESKKHEQNALNTKLRAAQALFGSLRTEFQERVASFVNASRAEHLSSTIELSKTIISAVQRIQSHSHSLGSQWRAQLGEMEGKISALEHDNSSLRYELKNMEAARATLEDAFQAQVAQVASRTEELDRLRISSQGMLDEQESSLSRLKAEIKSNEEALFAVVAKSKEADERFKKELRELKDRHECERTENNSLVSKITNDHRLLIEETEKQLLLAYSKEENALHKVQELERILSEVKAQKEILANKYEEETNSLRRVVHDQNKTLADLNAQHERESQTSLQAFMAIEERAKMAEERLAQVIVDGEERLRENALTLHELKSRCEGLQNKNKGLEMNLTNMQQQVAVASNQKIEGIKLENERLATLLSEAQARERQLTQCLEQIEVRNEKVYHEMHRLQKSLETKELEIERIQEVKNKEIENLHDIVAKECAEREELVGILEHMREKALMAARDPGKNAGMSLTPSQHLPASVPSRPSSSSSSRSKQIPHVPSSLPLAPLPRPDSACNPLRRLDSNSSNHSNNNNNLLSEDNKPSGVSSRSSLEQNYLDARRHHRKSRVTRS